MIIDVLSRKLTQHMLDKEIIKFEDWEAHMFGLQLMISGIFKFTGFMLFALAMGWVAEALIFLSVFSLIRVNAGGYHAKSYIMCFIVTGLMMITAILLAKTYLLNISFIGLISILIIASTVIFKYAPVDSPNRRLIEKERKVNRARSLIMTFGIGIIVISAFILYPQVLLFCNIAALSMLFEAITLLPIFAD